MRKFFQKLDWILLLSVVALVSFGTLMIYSASIGDFDKTNYVARQSIYFLIGLGLVLLIAQIGYKTLLHFAVWFYFLIIALLLITFVIGFESHGSVRWIDFGFFTLQASELAKPVLILFFSYFFTLRPANKKRNLIVSFILALIPAVLVFLQPDFGSAFVILMIWLVMVYLSGLKWQYLVSMIVAGAILIPVGFSVLKAYQKQRLLTFINPNLDPLGAGYNIVQSIIAVGSGQFLGRGFGRGTQSHLNFLPEQKTDFIFATTAEELGFLGIGAILALFSLIIYRFVKIASSAKGKAASLICYGAVSVIAIELFINAGMNMGLVPVTGITLPFISFGGSSLISIMILVGLVISIDLDNKS
ncbi:MAG TPA: rod shape-determining protein RodA [Candidatus Saccharimonadales bacterium]|nr:rod shape-determining protein RodA [Candidatus Saccharimonadales bacterium]